MEDSAVRQAPAENKPFSLEPTGHRSLLRPNLSCVGMRGHVHAHTHIILESAGS